MIQPAQTTPITVAIIGYLPAARIAEFQDESAGAIIAGEIEAEARQPG